MRCWFKLILGFGVVISGFSYATNSNQIDSVPNAKTIVVGSIIEVPLSSLRPTQSVIAHDQVNYKLALYQQDRKHLFADLCKNAGWGRKVSFNEASNVSEPQSYECIDRAVKPRKIKDLKTAVLGPSNTLYLTDGHHTFSTFFDMPKGGDHFMVSVYVQDNLSELELVAFWQQITNTGKAWLRDELGDTFNHHEMPDSLGRANLRNDPYRAALYFLRGGVWAKPKPAIEFVEFYWAQYLRQQTELTFPGYYNAAEYLQWLERTHAHLLQLTKSTLIYDSFTADDLGWRGVADYATLDSLLCDRNSGAHTLGSLGLALSQRGMPIQCDTRQFIDKTVLSTGLSLLPAAINPDGSVNVLVEISAGSHAKWQQNKAAPLELEWEFQQGKPRHVDYLAYPTNYGIVTNTILSKEQGGDGDPLDILVLGDALPQGTIHSVRVIAVMRMLDEGEQDDKLIAVPLNGRFSELNNLAQLQAIYPGLTEHLQHWFEHYKGDIARIDVTLVEDAAVAMGIVKISAGIYSGK
jgi:inorganic pyrophosphatase